MAGYKNGSILGILLVLASFCHLCTSRCTIPTGSLDPCGDCIAKGCAWCADPKLEKKDDPNYKTFQRCNTWKSLNESNQCGKEFIEYHKSKLRVNVIQDQVGNVSRLSPRNVTLKLAVNQPLSFNMKFIDGGNKPLDLYYIMDLSATMKDDKKIVAAQSDELAKALEGLTMNLQLGFGSFIDKPLMPYATAVHVNGDYNSSGTILVPPYLFKNHLTLTNNTGEFKNTIKDANISANSDPPEGGLEALMQAVVCTSQIGWREESRKLVVLSTDGIFHIAGDGKLGGLVKPHDSQCHMPNNFDYTHGTKLDYPSITQVNAKVSEKNMNVIFAVVKEHENLYTQLQSKIKSSSVVILSENSDNVVDVIKNEYKKISSTLIIYQKLKSASTVIPKLKITYSGTCPNDTPFTWTTDAENEERSNTTCKNFAVNSELNINVTVELLSCDKATRPIELEICPSEVCNTGPLRLVIEPICECSSCKTNKTASFTSNTTECSNGHWDCGLCTCNEGYRGRHCDCKKVSNEEANRNDMNDPRCKQPADSELCSGNGECNCGKCECKRNREGQPIYSGTFCQFNCLSDAGEICSNHGTCENATCTCEKDWTGEKCECSKTSCMEPGSQDGNVCNGNGVCVCTANITCECRPGSGFGGRFCHINTRLPQPDRCDCIKKCEASLNPKDKTPECPKSCLSGQSPVVVEIVKNFNRLDPISCSYKDSEDCTRDFAYGLDWFSKEGDKWVSTVQLRETKSCPSSPTKIIIIVVVSVVLIGIFLLLIWKVVTTVHDRREYQRFKKDISGAKWGEAMNPLYKGAESEFQNPAYTQR